MRVSSRFVFLLRFRPYLEIQCCDVFWCIAFLVGFPFGDRCTVLSIQIVARGGQCLLVTVVGDNVVMFYTCMVRVLQRPGYKVGVVGVLFKHLMHCR